MFDYSRLPLGGPTLPADGRSAWDLPQTRASLERFRWFVGMIAIAAATLGLAAGVVLWTTHAKDTELLRTGGRTDGIVVPGGGGSGKNTQSSVHVSYAVGGVGYVGVSHGPSPSDLPTGRALSVI